MNNNVVSLLKEAGEGGVLRIGKLYEEYKIRFEFDKSIHIFRKLLLDQEKENINCNFKIEDDGYICLKEVNFSKWRADNRDGRKSIPESTKLKLWAKSAGRCQFNGCLKELAEDSLTLSEVNEANIAHIIAAKPDGPRGSLEDSERLQISYSNLMLMCYDHHKLIDTLHENYSIELLRQWKEDHEKQIEFMFSVYNNMKTNILIVQSSIGKQNVSISIEEAIDALENKKYPSRNFFEIDISKTLDELDGSLYWESGAKDLLRQIQRLGLCDTGNDVHHLSIFSLMPIPFLILLGRIIGDKFKVDIFQRHRHKQDHFWRWNPASANDTYVSLSKPEVINSSNNVLIAFSISYQINEKALQYICPESVDIYRFMVEKPSAKWLSSREQLLDFEKKFFELQENLESNYGKNYTLHILGPMPAPFAIACGLNFHPKASPEIITYEYINELFCKAITIPKGIIT